MAEESGLKPALTAEEWNQVSPSAISFLIEEQVSRDAMHTVAALALYEQSFGFTREDVKALRETADRDDAELQAGNNARTDVDTVALRSLADRIEALLPPEKS